MAMSESPPATIGRKTKGQRTRRRILDVARQCFAEEGFSATIRGIAEAAKVDKAAVMQYFGSKDQLFREAITLALEKPQLPQGASPATLARMIIGFAQDRWRGEPAQAWDALARTSFVNEAAADRWRDALTDTRVVPIADAVEGPDARLRAALVTAFMFGIHAHRGLLKLPDLSSATEQDIARYAQPAVEALLNPPAEQGPGERKEPGRGDL